MNVYNKEPLNLTNVLQGAHLTHPLFQKYFELKNLLIELQEQDELIHKKIKRTKKQLQSVHYKLQYVYFSSSFPKYCSNLNADICKYVQHSAESSKEDDSTDSDTEESKEDVKTPTEENNFVTTRTLDAECNCPKIERADKEIIDKQVELEDKAPKENSTKLTKEVLLKNWENPGFFDEPSLSKNSNI
jgi:hypothetical protein